MTALLTTLCLLSATISYSYFTKMQWRSSYVSLRPLCHASSGCGSTQLPSSSSLASSKLPSSLLEQEQWIILAKQHKKEMVSLLYPSTDAGASSSDNWRRRQHLVKDHPIYNFLHRYYRYTTDDLLKYSPGLEVALAGIDPRKLAHCSIVHCTYMQYDHRNNNIGFYHKESIRKLLASSRGKFGGADLVRNRDVLRRTSNKPPFFGCFGLHEWAMLYSGRRVEGSVAAPRHQENLALRVPQRTIDEVVEGGELKCTHFDAWRFFHPAAQPWNMIPAMSRANQRVFEQPGCVHANMDLFKFAFQLHPFLPSTLLRDSLALALQARHIDMRASPYDVSKYVSGEALRVETDEGRRQYATEQEILFEKGREVRRQILANYDDLLGDLT